MLFRVKLKILSPQNLLLALYYTNFGWVEKDEFLLSKSVLPPTPLLSPINKTMKFTFDWFLDIYSITKKHVPEILKDLRHSNGEGGGCSDRLNIKLGAF